VLDRTHCCNFAACTNQLYVSAVKIWRCAGTDHVRDSMTFSMYGTLAIDSYRIQQPVSTTRTDPGSALLRLAVHRAKARSSRECDPLPAVVALGGSNRSSGAGWATRPFGIEGHISGSASVLAAMWMNVIQASKASDAEADPTCKSAEAATGPFRWSVYRLSFWISSCSTSINLIPQAQSAASRGRSS